MNQELFSIFYYAWVMGVIFLVKALGIFDLADSGPFTGVGFWDRGTETGAGGGSHRL